MMPGEVGGFGCRHARLRCLVGRKSGTGRQSHDKDTSGDG